jgi:hypothetical protein
MSTRTERPLKRDEKRTVALLGVPTLALALVVTLVTTYLPVVAPEFVRSTVGGRSDRRHRGFGGALAPARRRQLL